MKCTKSGPSNKGQDTKVGVHDQSNSIDIEILEETSETKQEYRLNVKNQLIMHLAAQNWDWHWQTLDRPVLLEDSKTKKGEKESVPNNIK
jgi:hypothetical protein